MMGSIEIFTHEMLSKSDLVSWSFNARSGAFSPEMTSNMMGWLAERYLLGGCAYLASAIAYEVGRDRFVSFHWPDGRMSHTVIACSDQYETDLKGYGVDILGKRPLSVIRDQISALASAERVSLGVVIDRSEFDDGELSALVDLASSLPWLAKVMRRPPIIDAAVTLSAMRRLGYQA